MSGYNTPESSTPSVPVSNNGNEQKSVTGVNVETTEVAMRVTDCGRQSLSNSSFKALAVTTTAGPLNNFNTNREDVVCARGIQLKASTANSAVIVIGGSDVVANASAANINGLPLAAGDTIFLEITQLSSLWAQAASGTQYLHWLAY